MPADLGAPPRHAQGALRTRIRSRGRPTRADLVGALPTVVLLAALVACAAELLRFTDGIWFFADDWDFLFRRGTIPSADVGWWAPHNGDWMTGQTLLYRGMFAVFGLASYLPWSCLAIGLHLAVSLASYLLLRQAGARRWAAVGGGLLVAFFGAGAQAQLWSGSVGHLVSLLCGLVAALAIARIERRLVAVLLVAVLLAVAVVSSDTGLPMVVLVAVFGSASRGPLLAVPTVLPAATAYGAWWAVHSEAVSTFHDSPDLARLPEFVWTGVTGSLENGSGLTASGPVLLAALVGCLLLTRAERTALVSLAGAGLVADLVQLVLLSTRVGIGPESSDTGLNGYVNVVLLTPAVALLFHTVLGSVRSRRWVVGAVGLAALAAYVGYGWTQLQSWHDQFALASGGGDDLALGMRDAYQDGQLVLTDADVSTLDYDFRPSYVIAPQIRGALPDRPADPQWRLEAEGRFFVGVGAKDYALAQAVGLKLVTGLAGKHSLTPDLDRPGCHTYTATAAEPVLELSSDDGGEIVVRSSSTLVKTILSRGTAQSTLQEWPVQPGAVHVATSARHAQLLVSFNGTGSYTVCKR